MYAGFSGDSRISTRVAIETFTYVQTELSG
jgi:hypothetical protein